MTNIYKEKTSCDCANSEGAPDVLYKGDVVEARDALPKQKINKGQRAIVDKIYPSGDISILPFGSPRGESVRVKDVYKLNWGS